jgi:hypothetical protein
MIPHLEYDVPVRRRIPASVAVFGLFFFFVPGGYSQVPGIPPTGAVGHLPTGAVISPTGPVRPPTGTVPNVNSLVPAVVVPSSSSHQHLHHHRDPVGPVWYALPVPYPVDMNGQNDQPDDSDAEEDPNYQGGPTVFDRRGGGADSYVPPVEDMTPAHGNRAGAAAEEAAQPTQLVFKDGHKLEVGNYAIIGQTLFDMTPGHSRRVPLSDLDLEATRELNEQNGIIFQVPTPQQAN